MRVAGRGQADSPKSCLCPGLVAPFAAAAGDRFRHDRFLVGGYIVQGLTMGATAVAMYGGAPPLVIVAAATTAATAVTLTRPAQAVILPTITHSPADLTAANAVSGIAEGIGLFLGPLLAGVLLGRSEPGDVFAAFAGLSAVNAILVMRTSMDDGAVRPPMASSAHQVLTESFAGFGVLRRQRSVQILVVLLTASMVVFGALDVLSVAIAIDMFDAGEAWAGYVMAAVGLGAIAGAFAAVGLVGRRRLTPAFAVGGSLQGLPIAAVAAVPTIGAAAVAVALSGIGSTLNAVAGRTLLQRVAPEAVLGRVFGVVEGLAMFALALGSVIAGFLVALLGVPAALIVAGVFLPTLVALAWRQLTAIDRHARAPDPEALALLRHIPIFAPLSAPTIERILAELTWLEPAEGHVLIRQGERGDRFYVIAEGLVAVSQDGRFLGERGRGDYLGEIALLRDMPRTATVTTRTGVRAIAIDRDRFLEAVTGHAGSRQHAETAATERLMNKGPAPD